MTIAASSRPHPAGARGWGATGFSRFSTEALQFLVELTANNERTWFQPRKAEYERLLKQPVEALCVALGERFAERAIPLVADPGRSPFRIHRDTRFSKDKSPYKPYVSASFPWKGGGPGGYFSLRPGEIYLGGGMYHPEPPLLSAWRTAVASRPAEVHAAPRGTVGTGRPRLIGVTPAA